MHWVCRTVRSLGSRHRSCDRVGCVFRIARTLARISDPLDARAVKFYNSASIASRKRAAVLEELFEPAVHIVTLKTYFHSFRTS